MQFIVRSFVVAVLTTLVGFTLLEQQALQCPSPRFESIGHTGDGKAIIVFDACLGFAYATPIAGLDLLIQMQQQKERL
jgi:uncharacterized membrane protein